MSQTIRPEELQRLRESEERYRKMIERANDAILSIDISKGIIVEANPKAEAMTGSSAEELIGMPVWNLHPTEEIEEARKLFDTVAREGEGFHCELHFRRQEDSKVAVDVRPSVIEYGNKRVIQRICRDVTRQRELQLQTESGRVSLVTSNYFGNNGVWYAVEIVQDITELKQLERQLHAANEELEAKVGLGRGTTVRIQIPVQFFPSKPSTRS